MRDEPFVVLVGVATSGKSTLLRHVCRVLPIVSPISCTTRAPRKGEIHGVDYYFLHREEFLFKVSKGLFVEWAEVHGEMYGLLKNEVMRTKAEADLVCCDLDVQGAESARRSISGTRIVYIDVPEEEMRRRLQADPKRNHTEEEITRRLKSARREREWAPRADFFISNVNLDQAKGELTALLTILMEGGEPELSRFCNPTIIRRCTKVASQ